jgi:hypothetical protein
LNVCLSFLAIGARRARTIFASCVQFVDFVDRAPYNGSKSVRLSTGLASNASRLKKPEQLATRERVSALLSSMASTMSWHLAVRFTSNRYAIQRAAAEMRRIWQ